MANQDNKFVHSVRASGSSHVLLPSLLIEKLFREPPSKVVLTAVDDIPWTVFTVAHGSELYLGRGWDTFRDIYVFGDSDIAEFTYDSSVGFRVCVFGPNMLARGFAEVEERIGLHYKEFLPITAIAADQSLINQLIDSGILVGSVLNLTETPRTQLKRKRLVQAADQFNKSRKSVYSPPNEDFLVANNATRRSPSPDLSSDWLSNSDQDGGSPVPLSSGTPLPGSNIGTSSRGFRRPAGSPHSSIDITPATLQNGYQLPIPSVFATSQLVRGANKRILHVIGGGQYTVICLLKGKRANIVSGWREFASAHQLAPGDRCVFQQSLRFPNTWDVSFFWGQ